MQVLVDLVESDPTADNDRLFKSWWPIVQDDEDLLLAVARHAFTNMASALDRDRRKSTRKRRPEHHVQAERVAVAKISERVRNIVLMELTLPNGKKLRQASFKECSAAGGWFKLLACKGKPSEIVGKVLTEDDLRKIGRP